MCMKPKNAGKDMWLRAQTENENLKNAQRQDADGVQAVSVLLHS